VRTFVHSVYSDSEIGVETELQSAGTTLENPYVYDSAARDLKSMAEKGLVQITGERLRKDFSEPLIGLIRFARIR
jgi:hypothetical protein